NNSVLEVVDGVRLTRSYVREKGERRRFRGLRDEYLERFMKVERLDALFQPLTVVVTMTSFMVDVVEGAVLANKGVITAGDIVTFNIYLNMLVWPMFALGMLFNILQRGNASLTRIYKVLDTEDDVNDDGNDVIGNTDMNFDDVSFTYPLSKRENLRQVSIKLKSGQTLGIAGRTGSGKTTLIKQLLKYYPQGRGRLVIDDMDIGRLGKKE